jgi:hypothetical protein
VGEWIRQRKTSLIYCNSPISPFSDGKGRQTYVNDDVYNGEWKAGKMHGKVSVIVSLRHKNSMLLFTWY